MGFDEKAEIEVNGKAYTVIALMDGTFDVFINGKRLGNIHPKFLDGPGLVWVTGDLITPDIVSDLGEAIERMEL